MVIIMTGGVITRRDWVLWNVTLREAIEWCQLAVKDRAWWLEALFGSAKKDTRQKKPCRHADMCAMCRKVCDDRITG